MSDVPKRFDARRWCLRHNEPVCPSCLTYENNDLRDAVKQARRRALEEAAKAAQAWADNYPEDVFPPLVPLEFPVPLVRPSIERVSAHSNRHAAKCIAQNIRALTTDREPSKEEKPHTGVNWDDGVPYCDACGYYAPDGRCSRPAPSEPEKVPSEVECWACRGYGHFSKWGKPSIDKADRNCLECGGVGKRPPSTCPDCGAQVCFCDSRAPEAPSDRKFCGKPVMETMECVLKPGHAGHCNVWDAPEVPSGKEEES